MKIAAIPTTYNGVNFRSRLEARWAALFDLLSWKWEYEPFDLNGWIPDFVLSGYKKILVEIKPYDVYRNDDSDNFLSDCWEKQLNKINIARPEYDVLLLSGNCYPNITSNSSIGAIYRTEFKESCILDEVSLVNELGRFSIITEPPLITIKPEFSKYEECDVLVNTLNQEDLIELWKKAGNIVQWKRK